MKVKSPPQRRRFANDWDEVAYLYDKLIYWLYQRENAGKARPFAIRLERLLPKVDPDHEAIRGAECRSLVDEAKGDLPKVLREPSTGNSANSTAARHLSEYPRTNASLCEITATKT